MLELVTGGLGFIGSVYVACAVRAGRHCIVVDRDSSKKNLLRALPRVEVIIADLLSRERITALVAQYQPQIVHHFAAHSAVGAVPETTFAENVTMTANLLAALQAGRSDVGLVFASSCSVYGDGEGVSDETTTLHPISAYARSKVACERLLRDAVRNTQLAAVSLRYANVAGAIEGYGEQFSSATTRLIPKLIAAARHNEVATIFGYDFSTPDGTCRRDYVHVRDVVAAHERAAVRLQPGRCMSFNICAGTSHSNLEVVRAVEQISGRHLRIKMAARRKGDPAAVQLSKAKAARTLGFVAQHSELATIIGDTHRWLNRLC